jgi:predicted ester cyclase
MVNADSTASNDAAAHEEIVRRYFHEVLDRGRIELIDGLFHPECIMHRPGGTVTGIESVRGVAERRKATFSQFETQIHDVFGDVDRLAVRLTHRGTGCGMWRSRLGSYDVTGKVLTWNAIAIFRFENQKIVEEWVVRDELGMMLQAGVETAGGKR